MAIPSVTCGSDILDVASSIPRLCALSATATNGPITAWQWTLLSAPSGSTAGESGDFTSSIATVQNPSVTCDIAGGSYVFQCVATNVEGQSNPNPEGDWINAQQIVTIKTADLALQKPGLYQHGYADMLNDTIDTIEAAIVSAGGSQAISFGIETGSNANGIFDDFDDDSLDTSIWTASPGNGSIAESGGSLNLTIGASQSSDWSSSTQNAVKVYSVYMIPSDIFTYVFVEVPNVDSLAAGLTVFYGPDLTLFKHVQLRCKGGGAYDITSINQGGTYFAAAGPYCDNPKAIGQNYAWIGLERRGDWFSAHYCLNAYNDPPTHDEWIQQGGASGGHFTHFKNKMALHLANWGAGNGGTVNFNYFHQFY